MPSLERPSSKMVSALAGRAGKIGGLATLLKVFLPYLVWNTVFDNTRVVAEMGRQPIHFLSTAIRCCDLRAKTISPISIATCPAGL